MPAREYVEARDYKGIAGWLKEKWVRVEKLSDWFTKNVHETN